jgi:hypothetical protein
MQKRPAPARLPYSARESKSTVTKYAVPFMVNPSELGLQKMEILGAVTQLRHYV